MFMVVAVCGVHAICGGGGGVHGGSVHGGVRGGGGGGGGVCHGGDVCGGCVRCGGCVHRHGGVHGGYGGGVVAAFVVLMYVTVFMAVFVVFMAVFVAGRQHGRHRTPEDPSILDPASMVTSYNKRVWESRQRPSPQQAALGEGYESRRRYRRWAEPQSQRAGRWRTAHGCHHQEEEEIVCLFVCLFVCSREEEKEKEEVLPFPGEIIAEPHR